MGEGDWLTLFDEPGFMQMLAEHTKQPILQRLNINPSQIGEEFTVTVDKSGGGALGIDVDLSGKTSVLIEAVRPGLIANWNSAHPKEAVKSGDILVDCNGERDDCEKIVGQCKNANVLKMLISRSKEVPTWRVTPEVFYPVFSEKSTEAAVLGTKRRGDRMLGVRDEDWLVLADEPGFMRIVIDREVLEKVDDLTAEYNAAPDVQASTGCAPGTFFVTLDKAGMGSTKLGVDVSVCDIDGRRYLKIKKFRVGGLLMSWNSQNPSEALKEGDIIMDVNGIRGNSEELYATIANDEVLKLLIMRKELL